VAVQVVITVQGRHWAAEVVEVTELIQLLLQRPHFLDFLTQAVVEVVMVDLQAQKAALVDLA
jgi:hypothetical protein